MIKGEILLNKLLPIENLDLFIGSVNKKYQYLGLVSANTTDVSIDELSDTLKFLNQCFKENDINVILIATMPGISFTLHELLEKEKEEK